MLQNKFGKAMSSPDPFPHSGLVKGLATPDYVEGGVEYGLRLHHNHCWTVAYLIGVVGVIHHWPNVKIVTTSRYRNFVRLYNNR